MLGPLSEGGRARRTQSAATEAQAAQQGAIVHEVETGNTVADSFLDKVPGAQVNDLAIT
ncbi:hypothetical protein [Streptomyces sp. NPDC047024]|uniref:hypothetical protein n=1 Tax=Streptomyces sp. NPDC047024 TaxID=3155476 RepID=UPI0033F2C7C7